MRETLPLLVDVLETSLVVGVVQLAAVRRDVVLTSVSHRLGSDLDADRCFERSGDARSSGRVSARAGCMETSSLIRIRERRPW